MKFSLLCSVVILALAAISGWWGQQRLAVAREKHDRLLAEADSLGVATADLRSGGKGVLPGKSVRGGSADREARARDFAARLANFALAMEARQQEGNPQDEEFQKEIFELLDEMLQLDAPQLKILIAELRANPALSDEMRRNIVGLAITMLAESHPAAALALFTGSTDLFGEEQGGHVISTALSKWAEQDPAAALAWVRENAGKHPELVTEDTKRGLVTGAARQDPRLAFQLIGELGLAEFNRAGDAIGNSATTPGERAAVLAALRDHLKAPGVADDQAALLNSTITALGRGAMKDGFDAAVAWFDGAGLSEAEAKAFTTSLSPWHTQGDTGKWIDWMGGKLSGETLGNKVTQMMSQWTRTDYKAAGLWLNQAAEGPAKQAAVDCYARTVAPYDPAAAGQWARTLPAGKDRDELLQAIENAGKPVAPGDLEWTDPD